MAIINFSNHAIYKIKLLKSHGLKVDRNVIISALCHPDKVMIGYGGRKIAKKTISQRHVLRVVFEEIENDIMIIALYPGNKERYEKN